MWLKVGFGAAFQHSSQHHERGPGMRGNLRARHMIQQQFEEDLRWDEGPQQFRSSKALDVGTGRDREHQKALL